MLKKPIILAAGAAVVILALGWFVVLPMLSGGSAAAEHDAETAEHHDEEEDAASSTKAAPKKRRAAAEPGLIYPVSDRVLNLASVSGTPRYARIELALEFEKPATATAHKAEKAGGHAAPAAKDAAPPLDPALEPVSARKVLIDDAIVRIVGSKTMEQLITAEGKETLKAEILDAVSEIVITPEPVAVYIVRLVVQ